MVWRRWCFGDNSAGELDWVLDGADSFVFLPHNWWPELPQFDPTKVSESFLKFSFTNVITLTTTVEQIYVKIYSVRCLPGLMPSLKLLLELVSCGALAKFKFYPIENASIDLHEKFTVA